MSDSLALIITGLSLLACACKWVIARCRIDVSVHIEGRPPGPGLLCDYHTSKRCTIFCAIVFLLVVMT